MMKMMKTVALLALLCGMGANVTAQLAGGNSSAVRADKKLPASDQPPHVPRAALDGEVTGGRELQFYFVPNQPAEPGAAQNAAIAANIAAIRANTPITTISQFAAEHFMSNKTVIAYFKFTAGTGETVPATGLGFVVGSTDASGSRSNLWADTITFTVDQGYSTELFPGVRTDGALHPTGTPLTTPSRQIIGAIKLKYLPDSADEATEAWFRGYVGLFPNLQIRITPTVQGTAMPAATVQRGMLTVRPMLAANGDLSLVVETSSDTTSYTLQTSQDINASNWQTVKRVTAGEVIPWGNARTNASSIGFARLVYIP